MTPGDTLSGYAEALPVYLAVGHKNVLPLPPRAKTPPPVGFTGYGWRAPTPEDYARWSVECRDGNTAIHTGDTLIGLDKDCYDGKTGAATMAEAERLFGPRPPTWSSGSRDDGSGIWWYGVPAGTHLFSEISFPELGIRHVEVIQYYHRFATVWPSIHPDTGQMYFWRDPDGVRVADGTVPGPGDFALMTEPWLEGLKKPVPKHRTGRNPYRWGTCAWERERLWRRQERQQQAATTGNTKTGGHASDKVAERLAQAIADLDDEGNRHDATRDHVLAIARFGEMGEPGTADALDDLCEAFVEAVTNDGSRTPAEATHEFTRLVAGAEDLIAADPSAHAIVNAVWPRRGRRREDGMDTDDQAGAQAGQEQDATKDAGEESSLLDRLARDGAWLDNQRFAPLEYAVPGIIPEGMGLLVGPPKKGKSWLVANIGLAVARGGLALGAIRTTQRPVLYLALEDGDRRLQSRFRRLLGFGQPIPPGIRRITEASPGEAMAVIAEFMHRYADEKPLVILDTLGKVKRHKKPGEDSYLVDYEVGSTLKKLADAVPGSTLLVVHHTRKAEAADFVDTVSGTQGIAGSVDFVLVLTRKRHENNAILSVTGRDIVEAEYALHADDGVLWRLDGEDLAAAQEAVHQRRAESNLGDRMMDVYLVVQAADGPVTAVDVANQMDGLDNNAAGTYLRRLFAGGYITRVSRGLYGVSEVSEVSETRPNSSSEGVNDSDTASDGVSEVSESPSDDSSTSDTSDSVSEAVSESNTAADQAEHADSDTSDTSDTHPEDEPTDTALAMTSRCPTCGTAPGRRCATVLARGYHIARMNKAVRRQRKTDRTQQPE